MGDVIQGTTFKKVNDSAACVSDTGPDFTPATINLGTIQAYSYQGSLKEEIERGRLTPEEARGIFEDMLMVRELEEMIAGARKMTYKPLDGYIYRGAAHLSAGQEAASVGACSALHVHDRITSTHRGHGDSLAKGTQALREMSDEELRTRVPGCTAQSHEELLEAALEDHVYRTIAELFGKEDGYCKGRGGGMHIADCSTGHLGANAIVGGGVPIATGAALAMRYLDSDSIVCSFAGDGAYANGAPLEALNFGAQEQFKSGLGGARRFGLPIVYVIENNRYGMTGRANGEVMGVSTMARRAAGFADNNMNAEVVNGMDVLAVRDALLRAAERCRNGEGPCLVELSTYRYYGHSLSDKGKEYRTPDEEAAWKAIDPIPAFEKQLQEAGVMDEAACTELRTRVAERNARAASRARDAADPRKEDLLLHLYTDTSSTEVPAPFQDVKVVGEPPKIARPGGSLSYKDAIREALAEEMMRDSRVIIYGEDVAEYGGAFKVTEGLLPMFGRDRVFNAPISESCIVGTAVGAAMVGLRPVVELMYMDFTLMASDQIANQMAKWHYMSGAQVEVPAVIRVSVGGGKGYAGQHSQTLEAIFAHIPGLYIVYPSNPYDAKGLLKSAIRDNNPVMFLESQLLYYASKGEVPQEDYTIPLGVADVKREGKDLTFVSWGPAVPDCLKAAEQLKAVHGVEAEVVDLRSIVPLDRDCVLNSARKTGHIVVASHAVSYGSFAGEIASMIQSDAFDYLDAPVICVGAKNGVPPQSEVLESIFLPNVDDLIEAARTSLNIKG